MLKTYFSITSLDFTRLSFILPEDFLEPFQNFGCFVDFSSDLFKPLIVVWEISSCIVTDDSPSMLLACSPEMGWIETLSLCGEECVISVPEVCFLVLLDRETLGPWISAAKIVALCSFGSWFWN